jgi:ribonucleoside-diphosphate reductase alpha chain
MFVTTRSGKREEVSFDKVLNRIKTLSDGLEHVNPALVAQKVCSQIEDGITTARLDEFAAETCAMMQARNHPNYGAIAARIVVDNHHKNTPSTFHECVSILYDAGVASHKLYLHSSNTSLEEMIDYSRDFLFDYFGFKTLEKGYLLRANGKVVERPQHMWMRVSLEIHSTEKDLDVAKVKETYDALSHGYFIQATPTLFNSGTKHPQLSSCYLINMKSDSIKGIYETLGDCAQISKWAGGIGLSVHKIRAKNSRIAGTNGTSTGIVPMLKVYNDTARYVNQGGKRNGSFAIYLEPWHADVEDFLRLKLNTGAEEDRARDLFYALWIPDLFMKRVESNGDWTLMCPNECPGLDECHSEAFEELYTRYEREGRGRKTFPAQKLWQMILDAQIQTGTPYLLYKDAANRKSNQQHLGTIKSSNLCAEIVEYSSPSETAVCNLGSVALSKYVRPDKTYDFEALRKYTSILADNLDLIIDRNFYPTTECETSNFKNRPIGIGVQGLADVFAKMGLSWTSDEARELHREIFENMYYAAISTSVELAQKQSYNTGHIGSPASKGLLQYHLWDDAPRNTPYLNWKQLEEDVKTYGLRNSLSIALMPTASTSQILGNNECFEPFTSNLYVRHVLAGDFIVVNKYLVEDLSKLGLWTSELRTLIIAHNGSIQAIDDIPADIKERYRTAWEIPQKTLIQFSRDRSPFVCQSQSLNLFVADPTYARISSMHMYAWKQGLKTGCYYLRTKAVASAQKFTVEPPSCTTCSA